jgi:hypothetical protein
MTERAVRTKRPSRTEKAVRAKQTVLTKQPARTESPVPPGPVSWSEVGVVITTNPLQNQRVRLIFAQRKLEPPDGDMDWIAHWSYVADNDHRPAG